MAETNFDNYLQYYEECINSPSPGFCKINHNIKIENGKLYYCLFEKNEFFKQINWYELPEEYYEKCKKIMIKYELSK
jgi:hypothetical protein